MLYIAVGLVAWTALVSQAPGPVSERSLLEAGDVVAAYGRTRENIVGRLHVRSRTIQEFDSPTSAAAVVRLAQQELYWCGQSVDLCTDGFHTTAAVDDANLPMFRRKQQRLWDGTTFCYVATTEFSASRAESRVLIDKNTHRRAEHIVAEAYLGAPLEGYFHGDHDDILAILREELPTDVSIRKMPLGWTQCYLLEAHIKGRGSYRLWCDPMHGYNICRVVLLRDANDLPDSLKKVDQFGRRVVASRFVLDNVVFEQFKDIWLPVAGQWEGSLVHDDGTMTVETRYYKRLEVAVGDSVGQHAFLPRVADGTMVQMTGERSGVRYIWRDGGPRPDVDWEVIKAIDSMVGRRVTEHACIGGEYPLLPFITEGILSKIPSEAAGLRAQKDIRRRAGYCGLYCVYAALRLSGVATDFSNLLNSRYLGSFLGSSFQELQQAAKDQELYAEPVDRLTARDLRASPHALILHVKKDRLSSRYGHYVLFLGMRDGQAVICDPPQVRRMPLAEVVSQWNGAALAVSWRPIEMERLVRHGRATFLISCVIALGAIGTIRVGRRVFPSFQESCSLRRGIGLTLTQAAILVSVLAWIPTQALCPNFDTARPPSDALFCRKSPLR